MIYSGLHESGLHTPRSVVTHALKTWNISSISHHATAMPITSCASSFRSATCCLPAWCSPTCYSMILHLSFASFRLACSQPNQRKSQRYTCKCMHLYESFSSEISLVALNLLVFLSGSGAQDACREWKRTKSGVSHHRPRSHKVLQSFYQGREIQVHYIRSSSIWAVS